MRALRGASRRRRSRAVRGIGLSGQMHGATLLDAGDRVLRPAILWNDGRSGAECAELERARAARCAPSPATCAMPGFTAPKLLWVAAHEPEIFRRTARVLLPKDYLRLRLTGEHVSEMSDAAGTLWLDVGARAWSAELLAATGLDRRGHAAAGRGLRADRHAAARRSPTAWGMRRGVVVAGGGGDNAAGAVGVGVIRPGDAFLSLGTSGVYFVAGDRFAPEPERGVHAFCHCLPRTWHQMSVILSAASCLSLGRPRVTGAASEAALLAEVESAADRDPRARLPALPVRRAHAAQRSRTRAASSSASRTRRRAPTSAAPCSRASPSRSPTARTRCAPRARASSASR